jgi:glycosyltransferase involved in cell wall biosynthesis
VIAHLIYPHGNGISCPQAIGRNVALQLAARGIKVEHHDWDELRAIRPSPGDVLIGHPHPAPWTVFRRSARQRGWRRVIAMAPYSHGDISQLAYMDEVIDDCDLFLAITGRYWGERIRESAFAHWAPKFVQVDLAVDRDDFPRVKRVFAAAGSRRFLYVGHSGWQKNVDYLSAIARLSPFRFGWIGAGAPISGVVAHGFRDFRTDAALDLVREYDFFITLGRSDANPTTLLESMAWGLIPVCTAQSGYEGEPGVVNVPLDDPAGAAAILRELQAAPDDELRRLQAANDARLASHFTWGRFGAQVADAIARATSPALGPTPAAHRESLRKAARASPYAPYRVGNVYRFFRGHLSRAIRRGRRS